LSEPTENEIEEAILAEEKIIAEEEAYSNYLVHEM
jgi:hypothetical protein